MHEISSYFLPRAKHHLDLEREIVRALENHDYRRAFGLADRRCRVLPRPGSRIHLLRAEALHHLGLVHAAIESVSEAHQLDPDDLLAARRMMAWSSGEHRFDAALTVAKFEDDTEFLKSALAILDGAGREYFARTNVRETEIIGWVTWKGKDGVRLQLASPEQSRSISLSAQPRHRLATRTRSASDFRIARPQSTEIQSFRITSGERLISDLPLPANKFSPRGHKQKLEPGLQLGGGVPFLTVIVPIYQDMAATQACLNSVMSALETTPNSKVLIVDDASPEAEIKRLVHSLAEATNVTLLVNDHNLGFVGAVNKALRETPNGDILLLNADTLVPKNAFNRLRSVVRGTLGIGTATPLSNNGEFTSFPNPNKSNSLPSLDRLEELDQAAATANADIAIDIPNGIGFCLYITRECLTAVTELSQDFYRGYLEDVDFCLRAEEAGFRNVCVPSVFVGHQGSRSFLGDKRSLVVRNLKVLDERYPRYGAECAAFLKADPLRKARAALENVMLSAGERFHLILCGDGAVREVALARGKQLAANGTRSLVVSFRNDGKHRLAHMVDPNGGLPQSVSFDIAADDDRRSFLKVLADLSPHIEITDPVHLPPEVISYIKTENISYGLLVSDVAFAISSGGKRGVRPDWRAFINDAKAIIAIDRGGADFAKEVLHLKPRAEIIACPGSQIAKKSKTTNSLGILALRASAEEFHFIREMSVRIADKPELKIVVLGTTLDDIRLMQSPQVLVTGSIRPEEVGTVISGHGIGLLLLDLGDPMFGHPLISSLRATQLPVAEINWSGTNKRERKGDLRIATGLSPQKRVQLVVDWLTNRTH